MQQEPVRLVKLSAAEFEGAIDAIEGGRIFGWAWDRLHPQDHVAIEVRLDEQRLAAGMADRRRDDLASNGIGDGSHAFELALAEMPAPDAMLRLAVVVTSQGQTGSLILRPRLDRAVEADSVLAPPLGRIGDLLDGILAANRQIMQAQQALAREIRAVGAAEDKAAAAAAKIEAQQDVFQGQIGSLEVMALRFDAALADLQSKLGKLERARSTELNLKNSIRWVGGLAAASLVTSVLAAMGVL